jgi:hypothetical protein
VGNNQNSRGAWHANTNKRQQEYAFGVSICLKIAVEATSKREDQNTEEKRLSHCSKRSLSQST